MLVIEWIYCHSRNSFPALFQRINFKCVSPMFYIKNDGLSVARIGQCSSQVSNGCGRHDINGETYFYSNLVKCIDNDFKCDGLTGPGVYFSENKVDVSQYGFIDEVMANWGLFVNHSKSLNESVNLRVGNFEEHVYAEKNL